MNSEGGSGEGSQVSRMSRVSQTSQGIGVSQGMGQGQGMASRFLSKVQGRNETMSEIKQLMKQVEIGLANRVMALVYEIYLDGQYRERTNMQMHDRIINLESRLASMEELPLSRRGAMDSGRVAGGVKIDGGMGIGMEWVEYQQAQIVEKYERVIKDFEKEVTQMNEALHALQSQNYQLKTQLGNNCIDEETELLIENLTVQLQTEKAKNRQLILHCQKQEEELSECESQLVRRVRREAARGGSEGIRRGYQPIQRGPSNIQRGSSGILRGSQDIHRGSSGMQRGS